MANRIRFHLDEHVDSDIARALRRHGIDVTTTVEAGLRTASDPAHWEYAKRERRVLVTHDADFLRLAAQNVEHPGIAFASKAGRSLGYMIRQLILIYEVLDPDEITNKVEYL